jgi:hypothetical protein
MSSIRVVEAPAGSTANGAAPRRVVLSLETIKSRRLAAGDWLTVIADGDLSVIGQIWPSVNAGTDGMSATTLVHVMSMPLMPHVPL